MCTGEARRSRDSADRAVEQLSVGSWFLDFGELEEKSLVSLEEKDGEAIGRNIQKETTVLTSPFLEVGGKENEEGVEDKKKIQSRKIEDGKIQSFTSQERIVGTEMGNICSALKPPKKVRGKEKYLFLKMDNVFPENVVCKELSNISNVRLLLIMTYQHTHTLHSSLVLIAA